MNIGTKLVFKHLMTILGNFLCTSLVAYMQSPEIFGAYGYQQQHKITSRSTIRATVPAPTKTEACI